jgi:hypothetical protein
MHRCGERVHPSTVAQIVTIAFVLGAKPLPVLREYHDTAGEHQADRRSGATAVSNFHRPCQGLSNPRARSCVIFGWRSKSAGGSKNS